MQSPFCVTDLVGTYGALNCDASHLSWTTNMILQFRSHQYYVHTWQWIQTSSFLNSTHMIAIFISHLKASSVSINSTLYINH